MHEPFNIGRVAQLSLSPGGVPKRPVESAFLGRDGFVGDWQNDRKHHGGPERAVCLYGLELIEALQSEGHPVAPGTMGENLTLSGVDFAAIQPGDRLRIGSAEIEITRPCPPCKTIGGSFVGRKFGRVSHKTHPGWSRLYAKVLVEGDVRAGDPVERLGR